MSTSDGNSTTRPLRRRQSKRFDRSGRTPIATGSTVIDADADADVDADVDVDVDADANVDANDELELEETTGDSDGGEIVAEVLTSAPTGQDDGATAGQLDESDDDAATSEASDTSDRSATVDGSDTAEGDQPAEMVEPTRPERRSTIVPVTADPARTLDQMAPCGRCGHDVSTVHIEVDGNVLMMESCDNCDTRRWQLAGEPIELQQALDHVGEHTGRRRS